MTLTGPVCPALLRAVVLCRAVLLPADALRVHVAVYERQALLRGRHHCSAVPSLPVLHGKGHRHDALQHDCGHRVPSGVLRHDWHAAWSGCHGQELHHLCADGLDGHAGKLLAFSQQWAVHGGAG